MSRSVSTAFKTEQFAQQTGTSIPILVEITDGTTTIRLCNNTEDIVYSGNTYEAYPMTVDLHPDADVTRTATLTLSSVDESIMASLRSMASPITATVVAVFYDDGTMEPVTAPAYELTGVSFTEESISATLTLETWMDNEFPADEMTPRYFPGVF